jgi:excinuclease ABC subunit B
MREIARTSGRQYERSDAVLERPRFRIRVDALEIFPSYAKDALRVEFFGDEIERIFEGSILKANSDEELETVTVYPANTRRGRSA